MHCVTSWKSEDLIYNFLWDLTYSVSDFLSAVEVSALFIICVAEHVYLILEILFYMFILLNFHFQYVDFQNSCQYKFCNLVCNQTFGGRYFLS